MYFIYIMNIHDTIRVLLKLQNQTCQTTCRYCPPVYVMAPTEDTTIYIDCVVSWVKPRIVAALREPIVAMFPACHLPGSKCPCECRE